MSYFSTQNPGIGGLDELTPAEEVFLTSLAGLSFSNGDIIYYNNGGLQRLAIGSSTHVLTVTGGLPVWAAASGSASWGSITGTLSNQTDLQTALDLKASKSFALAMAVAL